VDKIYITKNSKKTQELGLKFARKILNLPKNKSAVVLGLTGNLGSGKTTFLQGFAKGLGVKEKILSPTFVIMKRFKNFYHIDCYRLKNYKDILALFSAQGEPASGWKSIIKNSENIVAIEWSEKIKAILPKDAILIKFKFIDENKREINLKI